MVRVRGSSNQACGTPKKKIPRHCEWVLRHLLPKRFREEALPEDPPEASRPASGPLEAALEEEARTQLERAVATLPAEQRAVFVLRVVEEMSYKEIAETLGVATGTVMSRLSRAREKLRVALGPYLGTAAGGAA